MTRAWLVALAACSAPHAAMLADADSPDVAPPSPQRLGGELTATGARFLVWAPDADAVAVTGDFDAAPQALTAQGGGMWNGSAVGARAGQRYHYTLSQGGQTIQRSDPAARASLDANGESLLVDDHAYTWTSSFTPPPPSEQVIYELHVGMFSVPAGAVRGTYRSAIAHLDDVAALGANMIELMPVAEFIGERSWGYNPGAPYAVESTYGTPDDLRALVDAAHARGLGVIIDVVHNHYDDGPLLHCWDGDCLGKNGIYFYTNAQASTPWGPRPDFGRAEVRAYIRDNALMWLDEYRCDGLRWDSTANIIVGNPDGWSMLAAIDDAIDARFPGAIQIAEDWRNDSWISRPTAKGGAGLDSQWDNFVHDLNGTILATSDAARSMATVRGAIERTFNGHASERVVFTESHDEVANGRSRIPEMISPGDPGSLRARQLSTLGAAVAFTSPGIPMLFMGQEMLTGGYFADDHPLDWSRAQTYSGIVQLYTALAHARRNLPGLTGDGTQVFHVNEGAKVLAWRRWKAGGDDVVVIANFSAHAFATYAIGLPAGGTWHVRFHSDAAAYSPDFADTPAADITAAATARDGLPFDGALPLGPYSLVILSR